MGKSTCFCQLLLDNALPNIKSWFQLAVTPRTKSLLNCSNFFASRNATEKHGWHNNSLEIEVKLKF